jgi:hypothetical protein
MPMCPQSVSSPTPTMRHHLVAELVNRSSGAGRARSVRGLTLVEMLVSLVCVIMLMLAYTQLFSSVGTRITDARSMIDLTNRMRSAANRLRTDLAGHTCDLIPWQKPESGSGYFEYIEGPLHDKPGENGMPDDLTTAQADESKFLGDTDDVLMFTVRSKDGNFSGRYTDSTGTTQTVQSPVAEVVWFLRPTLLSDGTTMATPPTFTLYRHAYLVMPTYQGSATSITAMPTGALLLPPATFYQNNDISAHYDIVGGKFVANTLGDLTKRECRFGHAFINDVTATTGANGFPHPVYPPYLVPFGGNLDTTKTPTYQINTSNSRYGEDVVLTNVVAFDVQAWDPTAPVYTSSTSPALAVTPSDPGFQPSLTGTPPTFNVPSSLGAFADLNWAGSAFALGNIPTINYPNSTTPVAMSPFYSTGKSNSNSKFPQLIAAGNTPASFLKNWLFDDSLNLTNVNQAYYQKYGYDPAVYDTWSTHYEHDGINQVTGGAVTSTNQGDLSSSGFEQFSSNTETSPPYPVPLRGIKITIRCYEPDSRQMHETSVVESFVPE